jgi:hypothetical protein
MIGIVNPFGIFYIGGHSRGGDIGGVSIEPCVDLEGEAMVYGLVGLVGIGGHVEDVLVYFVVDQSANALAI